MSLAALRQGRRPHAIWAALGALSVACLWYAWSLPGGIGMFACIGLAFVFWYKLGSRGSWMALIVLGLGMGGVLGWQAVTGSRCPEPGTKVFLKEGKPPVGCNEMRTSAGVMASFFLMIALIGAAAPLYARRELDDELDDQLDELLDELPAG